VSGDGSKDPHLDEKEVVAMVGVGLHWEQPATRGEVHRDHIGHSPRELLQVFLPHLLDVLVSQGRGRYVVLSGECVEQQGDPARCPSKNLVVPIG
jgi:hypothetical protein